MRYKAGYFIDCIKAFVFLNGSELKNEISMAILTTQSCFIDTYFPIDLARNGIIISRFFKLKIRIEVVCLYL